MPRRSSTSRARYLAAWADRKREELIKALGGTCSKSGDGKCDGELEFHHPFGRDYEPKDFSRWQRIIKYRREAAMGLVELRCCRHNRRDNYKPALFDATPF
jgi:hypothetical protein